MYTNLQELYWNRTKHGWSEIAKSIDRDMFNLLGESNMGCGRKKGRGKGKKGK